MKRKLIVTLVASALELYVASATAQVGSCNLIGTSTQANAATPVTTGPLNPINGFPEYVTDSTGQSVQRCLDPVFCFASPVIPTDPFSIQIGSGVEAFYWGATGVVNNAAGKKILTWTAAAEAAFLQFGPNGEPINGAQFPFLRMRFNMGVPKDGTYKVVHPFGTDVFTVTGATGARDVFATFDKGLTASVGAPGIQGSVGPFLYWNPAFATAPAGFLGDGGVAAAPQLVLGSPCGVNYIEITGIDTAGNAVDFGVREPVLHLDSFGIQGAIFDGRVQTPLAATRNTYSRTLAGAGQIDTFVGLTTNNAVVTVKDGPTIPAGTSRIPTAQTLDRTVLNATDAIDSLSVVIPTATTVPPILAVTASDTVSTTIDPKTGATVQKFDPTTLNVHLVDFVGISQADYDPGTGVLAVAAASGDARVVPTLTLRDFGDFTPGSTIKTISTLAPPGAVTVDSSAGGTATAQVRVIKAVVPLAPTTLTAPSSTSTTVTLNWVDASVNESGFQIYSVVGTVRTLLLTTAANVTSATITGLTPATATTFQVDSFNASGSASSNTVVASTLALPLAPSAVVAALSTTQTRAIDVSWADNSADETGFVIARATTAAGPYTQVGTAPAVVGTGTRTFTDVGGTTPPAPGSTYFYTVTAVRGTDSSTVAQTAVGLAAPAAPTSTAAPTFGTVAANSVVVNWSDRSTNETGFQVWRRTGLTGAFAAVSAVLPTTNAAGVGLANTGTTFTDTTVAANTQYFYRVDVSNWAGPVQSVVSAAVTTPAVVVAATLNAVTSLAATPVTANPPALHWVDASTGETGYRVQRRTVTFSAAGVRTNGTFATVGTLAANALGFTDVAQTANAIVEYSVAPVNGATVGPVVNVLAVPGGISGVAAAPTFTRVGNTVTINWLQAGTGAANRAGVGGYSVQRCTVTAADPCAVASTGWGTVATTVGRTTVTATNTVAASVPTKTYRYRVLSTTGPNAVTTVTGTASPVSANLVR